MRLLCFRSFPELSNKSLTDTFSSRRKTIQKKQTYRKALHFQRQTIYCCSLSMCSSNRIGTVAHTKPFVLHTDVHQMYRWLFNLFLNFGCEKYAVIVRRLVVSRHKRKCEFAAGIRNEATDQWRIGSEAT